MKFEVETETLRGMTMRRHVSLGPIEYEFDRTDGRRTLMVNE